MKGWIIFNAIGWLLGGLLTILFIFLPVPKIFGKAPYEYYDYIQNIAVWFCFSAAVAIMQSLELRPWGVTAVPWISATVLGTVVPATLLTWLFGQRYMLPSITDSLIGDIIEILIVGAIIGLSQMMTVRRSFSNPGVCLWTIVNSLGLLALGFLTAVAGGIGYGLGKSLIPFLFTLGNFGLAIVGARILLHYIFILFTVPFSASLVTALPMGLIVLKYGKKLLNTNSASTQGS